MFLLQYANFTIFIITIKECSNLFEFAIMSLMFLLFMIIFYYVFSYTTKSNFFVRKDRQLRMRVYSLAILDKLLKKYNLNNERTLPIVINMFDKNINSDKFDITLITTAIISILIAFIPVLKNLISYDWFEGF